MEERRIPLFLNGEVSKKDRCKVCGTAEHFPEERSDCGRKLAPSLTFLHTQWAAGEYNISFLYQSIHVQEYRGSETSVRNYLTALSNQAGPQRRRR